MSCIGSWAPGLNVIPRAFAEREAQSGRRVFPIAFSFAPFSAILSLSTAFNPSLLLCSPVSIMINNKSLTHFYKVLISFLPCDGGPVYYLCSYHRGLESQCHPRGTGYGQAHLLVSWASFECPWKTIYLFFSNTNICFNIDSSSSNYCYCCFPLTFNIFIHLFY